ncbi:MAG TPA: monovalent cation/H+ antiporter complex subunit F [Pseudonocardiaceae bacterium]|nr:monovalent cation/H+ antiporter complex subunit F [Pseudonocardiaceae bacterium]
MTLWVVAACVLLIGCLVPAMLIAYRDTAPRRVVGMSLVSSAGTILMVVLCQAFNQSSYLIVPLVLALLSFLGTLVFTRLLGARDD